MTSLVNTHRGQRAAVIFGGPSLIEHGFDFGSLHRNGFVVLVESKALTPRLLDTGVIPDYFLMLFPEKCKDNALQHAVFQSFLADVNIALLLRREHQSVVRDMRERFDEYAESWQPNRVHKRFRWRPGIFLKDSPYDLLRHVPATRIIANRALLKYYFPEFNYPNPMHFFEQVDPGDGAFNLERYYTPVEEDGCLFIDANRFYNSAAIALYPLLRAMGFAEVYLLGMDMSMLGSMEYAALYTFKTMLHYRWFFMRAQRAFNGNFRANRPYCFRPRSEFDDLEQVLLYNKMQFIRVYDEFAYAAPVPGVKTVSLRTFERLGGAVSGGSASREMVSEQLPSDIRSDPIREEVGR